MTTTREEFEAWMHAECFQEPPSYCVDLAWAAWQAAHLAGQRAMRERAAVAAWSSGMDQHKKAVGMPLDLREVGSACASAIRALEVKPS